jgi:hypothetical protein
MRKQYFSSMLSENMMIHLRRVHAKFERAAVPGALATAEPFKSGPVFGTAS